MATFLGNTDTQKVEELMTSTTENVQYFEETCRQVVNAYSEALDNLMFDIYQDCIKTSNPSTSTLEHYFLELTNMIYFMGEKAEKLGIYNDMSKSAAKEVYSKAYLQSQVKDTIEKRNKTTVAECTATAELASQYESIVNSIYERAYREVKYKIDAAKDMMGTLRKVISRRMLEIELSGSLHSSGVDINE